MVGQLGVVQIGGRRRIPEKAAERGKRQVTSCRLRAGLAGKRSDEEPELAPEIAVARALDPARKLAQPRSAVVPGVALAGGPRGVGVVPRVEQRLTVQHAVLRDEEEDEPIHHAQELAVEVVQPELPAAQGFSQRAVSRVARESLAETLQRMLDAAAQLAQRAGALLFGLAGPFLEPAGLGPITIARCEPGRVGHHPDEHEVGEQLAGEDRFEVELEKGLARQCLVVPEDAQAKVRWRRSPRDAPRCD